MQSCNKIADLVLINSQTFNFLMVSMMIQSCTACAPASGSATRPSGTCRELQRHMPGVLLLPCGFSLARCASLSSCSRPLLNAY